VQFFVEPQVLFKAHDILEACLKQGFVGPLEFGVVMFGTLACGVEGRERRQFADNLRVGFGDCVSVIGCGVFDHGVCAGCRGEESARDVPSMRREGGRGARGGHGGEVGEQLFSKFARIK
jgi:hypothetical protein